MCTYMCVCVCVCARARTYIHACMIFVQERKLFYLVNTGWNDKIVALEKTT